MSYSCSIMGGMEELLHQLDEAITALADAALCPLEDPALIEGLDRIAVAENRLRAVKLHWVREIEMVRTIPAQQKATSANAWLRGRLHMSVAEAGRLLRAGRLLDTEPILDAAMSAGTVSPEHLTVIGKALRDLPDVPQ